MSIFFRNSDGCSLHRDEKYVAVCVKCEVSVCTTCMNSVHRGHEYLDNDLALVDYKQKLFISEKVGEENLNKYQEEIQVLTQQEQICNLKSEGLLIALQNRGKELKNEIDRLVQEMSKAIKESKKTNMDKITKAQNKAKKQQSQLASFLKQAKAELQKTNVHSILSLYNNINDAVDSHNNSRDLQVDTEYYKFTAGELRKENMGEMFGKLEMEGKKLNQENVYEDVEPASACILNQLQNDVEDLGEFKVSEKGITSICPFKEDRAFLCDELGKDLKLVKETGRVLRSLTANTKKSDIAITSDGVVLITCPDLFCIKTFSSDGMIRKFILTEDLHPHGISVHFDTDCIVVALVDAWDFNVTSSSKRLLRKYSSEGEIIQTIEGINRTITGGVKPLFVSPYKVRISQYNGDIGVVNWTSWRQGNVLVFTDYGTLKFTYPPKVNSSFEPQDMTFDSENQIVVADAVSKLLLLLNPDGLLLRTIYQCNNQPSSLGYFGKGKLWVGQSDGTVNAIKYLCT
ncbi:uncharacterized protein LOC134235341 [Saccostrea cucullata]|uniref:uncharacterized protein LOC134235341 n=1 Tax=Saccostrea cuccullata TaxID=36930 RepID=UPI002ED33F65